MNKEEVTRIRRARERIVKPSVDELAIHLSAEYGLKLQRQLNVLVCYGAPVLNRAEPEKSILHSVILRDFSENELYRLVQNEDETAKGNARRVYPDGRERKVLGLQRVKSSIRGALVCYDAMYAKR